MSLCFILRKVSPTTKMMWLGFHVPPRPGTQDNQHLGATTNDKGQTGCATSYTRQAGDLGYSTCSTARIIHDHQCQTPLFARGCMIPGTVDEGQPTLSSQL